MGGMPGRSEEGVHRKDAKGAKVDGGRVAADGLVLDQTASTV
jgi:hypothetical protein